ncbi:MAG: DMT family transporter [Thermoactinomyces sp.]
MKHKGVACGFLSGITWALDTVFIGVILTHSMFVSSEQALFLAPLVGTFLHDTASSLWIAGYLSLKGELKTAIAKIKTTSGRFVILGALLGGPLGMTFYVLAIKYLGSSYAASFSAVYPAVGAFFSFLILKDRLYPKNLVGLSVSILFIILLGYSGSETFSTQYGLGLLFIALCIFGWGMECVIVGYGMKEDEITPEQSLQLRQLVSAVTYCLFILPFFGGWTLATEVITSKELFFIVLVALAGTVSYLFYYKAIRKIGPTRAMSLNISYSAWAIFFRFLLFAQPFTFRMVFYCFMIIFGSVLTVARKDEFNIRRSFKRFLNHHIKEAN